VPTEAFDVPVGLVVVAGGGVELDTGLQLVHNATEAAVAGCPQGILSRTVISGAWSASKSRWPEVPHFDAVISMGGMTQWCLGVGHPYG
jgi:hypothetical protein